jgi:hypothetical protein
MGSTGSRDFAFRGTNFKSRSKNEIKDFHSNTFKSAPCNHSSRVQLSFKKTKDRGKAAESVQQRNLARWDIDCHLLLS